MPHNKRVTLRDVARHAQVSTGTVSMVLNGNPLVAAATRARVQEMIAELGYVYDRSGAQLRNKRTGIIGVPICDLSNPYFAEIKGRLLIFRFYGIHLLPQKQNDALSKGFISYSVNTNSNVVQGDLLKNHAYIYFDLNPPVITNFATTLVSQWKLNTHVSNLQDLKIYPNPCRGILNVQNPGLTDLPTVICNIYGKLIWSACIKAGQTTQINSQLWSGGIYYVKAGYSSAKIIVTP